MVQLCELSGPTFGFTTQELAWWAVTWRTLKNHKTAKSGGWALARVWALVRDNMVCTYNVCTMSVYPSQSSFTLLPSFPLSPSHLSSLPFSPFPFLPHSFLPPLSPISQSPLVLLPPFMLLSSTRLLLKFSGTCHSSNFEMAS